VRMVAGAGGATEMPAPDCLKKSFRINTILGGALLNLSEA
jgi:hypothetical protein